MNQETLFTLSYVVLFIAIGFLQCFWGYRLFRIILFLLGLFFGGYFFGIIGYNLSQQVIVAVVIGIIGGLILGLLLYYIYLIGIFILGAMFGSALAVLLSNSFGVFHNQIVVITCAVVLGILAVLFQKLLIILSTSFCGALYIVNGISMLAMMLIYKSHIIISTGHFFQILIISGEENLDYKWGLLKLLGFIILGVLGVIVQYTTNKCSHS